MKRNIALLTDQVRSAIEKKCLNAIITEAYINALPFNSEEVASEMANLAKYSSGLVNAMSPETLLDRALENANNDPKYILFVKTLKDNISAVVESATKRVVSECDNSDTPNKEIIEAIKLDDSETAKLVEASKKSGIDAVSKLVKNKVINVIKDEKNAYEESAKIREEIKEVIRETPKNDGISAEQGPDDAIESYLDIILKPSDPRAHVSLFSKLQDVCMESLQYSTEEYNGEIPYKTMSKITMESTLPYFNYSNTSLIEDIERFNVTNSIAQESSECDEEMMAEKKKKIAKTAFICSICILTFLETLKSMHMIKPSVSDIRNFVDKNTNISNMEKRDLKSIDVKLDSAIDDIKKTAAMGSLGAIDLENKKSALECVKSEIMKMAVTESESPLKETMLSKINNALNTVDSPVTESLYNNLGYFENRKHEENISGLEYAIKAVSRKPNVVEKMISIDSTITCKDTDRVNIEVNGLDKDGKIVATSTFPLHCLESFGATAVEILRNCAEYINLENKNVKLNFTDGGYSVNL